MNEIQQFITDFDLAIQAAKDKAVSAAALRKARKAASSLAKALSEVESPDLMFSELERRAIAIETKLSEVASKRPDLDSFTGKARAMLALEGILPASDIKAVRGLLKEAEQLGGGTRRSGTKLGFDIGVECLDCKKLIVGGARGTPRWPHARTFITRHDKTAHEGFSPEERLELKATPGQIAAGAEQIVVKRYRIFRMSSQTS